jgi:ligand-binding SRPBCC domain-containing protein
MTAEIECCADNGWVTVAFELVTEMPAEPARVFDLSLDVGVHTSSMSRSRERVVGDVRQRSLGLGDEVTWKAHHFGVPWSMTSKVTEWSRPDRFMDEQAHGPFAAFRHEHLFESTEGGGTRMTDRVTFRAPAGVLGRLAEQLILGRYLRKLIETRNDYLLVLLSPIDERSTSD